LAGWLYAAANNEVPFDYAQGRLFDYAQDDSSA